MSLRIDSKLNLVAPVETTEGTLFVHSMPLSREVFEKYFIVISKAFAMIYSEGLNVIAGPRIAALVLRKVAEDMGAWDTRDGVKNGLMAEIRRLSNVIVPGPGGWKTISLETAIQDKVLDADDVSEVEGIVVFFMLASAVHTRTQIGEVLMAMRDLWGIQTTSSNVTGFVASLQKSTEEEVSTSTLPTAAASSVPT